MLDPRITYVRVWKTSDGRTHKSERSAMLHLTEGDVFEFCKREPDPTITPALLCDWLVQNSTKLTPLLIALKNARLMKD